MKRNRAGVSGIDTETFAGFVSEGGFAFPFPAKESAPCDAHTAERVS